MFSLAFNRTVYNCVYDQNPCHWTISSSCYSALFKIVIIFLWHCHIVTLSHSTNALSLVRFPNWHQCGSLPEASGQGNLTISHLNICERTQQLFLRRLKKRDQKELWNIIKRQQAGQQNPPNSQRWPFLPPRIAHGSQSHFSTSSRVLPPPFPSLSIPPPFPLLSIPPHFPSLSIPPLFTFFCMYSVSRLQMGKNIKKCSELTQFLQRKSQFHSNITLRTCFPSLFDVSTMLKLRCSCLGAFWGRQFRTVFKILPRCRWDTTAPPNIIISSVSRQALLMWVPIIKRARKNTGFCPEVIWRAVKWARVERVEERWWCWCCWYTTGWPLLRMKVPMNGSLFYEAQVASVFIRTLPEKGALVLYLTKLPEKSRRPSCQKKEEEQVCRRHNALSPRADKHSPQLPTIKPLLTQIFTSHSFII